MMHVVLIALAAAQGCPATCYKATCDYWDGGYWGTCSALQSQYGCDCGGCACDGIPQGDSSSQAYDPNVCPMAGNGMCDGENTERCAYDGGDCCAHTCVGSLCGGFDCKNPDTTVVARNGYPVPAEQQVTTAAVTEEKTEEDETAESVPQMSSEGREEIGGAAGGGGCHRRRGVSATPAKEAKPEEDEQVVEAEEDKEQVVVEAEEGTEQALVETAATGEAPAVEPEAEVEAEGAGEEAEEDPEGEVAKLRLEAMATSKLSGDAQPAMNDGSRAAFFGICGGAAVLVVLGVAMAKFKSAKVAVAPAGPKDATKITDANMEVDDNASTATPQSLSREDDISTVGALSRQNSFVEDAAFAV